MKRNEPIRLTTEIADLYETEIMKWIFAMKEDFIAAAGVIQADVTETKTFSRKVFDWEVGRRERLKRTENNLG